jgi:predicted MFS family arabinose efflux permease
MFVNVPIGLAVLAAGAATLTETPRRRGRFDLAGAVTSTLGMTGVVLGLVEAGTSGWSSPITIVSLSAGAALLAGFVKIEATAQEPILPLRILANSTRAAANAARGLGYAGMYGMVFFLTQFLQGVQHHSSLIAGISFLPTPMAVFLSSQITSKILVKRVPPKVLMLTGSALSAAGLALLTQLGPATPYAQLLVSLILIGTSMGLSFVSLTTAALVGVDPADAGAASGVINVAQQLGAALGLAVLVTVFDSVTTLSRSSGLSEAAAGSAKVALTHGMDITFAVATAFALAAVTVIASLVRAPVRAPVRELVRAPAREPELVPEMELEMEPAA